MSRGPLRGPLRGPVRGPRLAHPTSTPPAPSIYDQRTAADLNTYLQTLLGSALDFTPTGYWPTPLAAAASWAEVVAGKDLVAQVGAVMVASPHGFAAAQVAGADNWQVADVAALNSTTQALAVLTHGTFTAPAGTAPFVDKGSIASPHYAGQLTAAGHPVAHMKQMGPPTSIELPVDVTGAAYRWLIPVARSITVPEAWCAIDGTKVQTPFGALLDLNNAFASFGLFAGPGLPGGVTCAQEWLAVWFGAAAENIRTFQAPLLTALQLAG